MNRFIQSLLVLSLLIFVQQISAQLPPVWKNSGDERLIPTATIHQYLAPESIVWVSDSMGRFLINPKSLLIKGTGQATLKIAHSCKLVNRNDTAGGILLDFGRELHGGIRLVSGNFSDKNPVKIRIRFGESVSEAMSEIGTKQNATNDHAMRDYETYITRLGTFETGNTGFRFVRIDLVEPNKQIELTEVSAAFVYRDIPYLGSFKCNDKRLNKIWETAAYTVHLNMQDYLWDGIKRDRLVWVGDMHPEVSTINAVFGYNDVVPKSLDYVRDQTQLPGWMNGISTYSMWWILIQYQWYMNNGRLDYLQSQKAYLLPLLDQIIAKALRNEDKAKDWRFLDWPSSKNKQATDAGWQSLAIMSLKAGSKLAEYLKEPEASKKCKDAVVELMKTVPEAGNSKQAAALLALSGLQPAEKMNREFLSQNGQKGLSTFYGYYVLEARAMAGDYQGAIDCIREYWGAMLDLGATTFWEDFQIENKENASPIDQLVPAGKTDIHGDCGAYCYKGFRHSFCHGWSSGPTPWLSEYVLGVKVLEPGCRKISIEAHLGDLQWVEGGYPTPHGVLKIKHIKNTKGIVETTYDAPKGVKVILK